MDECGCVRCSPSFFASEHDTRSSLPHWSVAHSTTVHELERKMNSQRLNERTRRLQQGPVRRKTGRAETGRTFCADGRPIEIRAGLMKSRESMCKHRRAMFGTSWGYRELRHAKQSGDYTELRPTTHTPTGWCNYHAAKLKLTNEGPQLNMKSAKHTTQIKGGACREKWR